MHGIHEARCVANTSHEQWECTTASRSRQWSFETGTAKPLHYSVCCVSDNVCVCVCVSFQFCVG